MRKLVFIMCVFVFFETSAQWKSISKVGNYEIEPYRQFSINPYNNQIWFVKSTAVSVIDQNGEIQVFNESDLGDLWEGSNIRFTFTPNHIYFAKDVFGLFSFDNFLKEEKYTFLDYSGKLSSNQEDVYLIKAVPNSSSLIYWNGTEILNTNKVASNVAVKNDYLYIDVGTNSTVAYYPDGQSNYQLLNTDPQYLGGIYNELKFSRHSDTLYVAGKKGISFAYNYDFLDTITPNNTTNIPSPNVLEIEFDHEDKLWAVFGDASDVPIGLAKLEGSIWVNRYDATNSPIDFNNYLGMEIDTLGNVWVVDNQNLHTLLSENSPAWLSTVELKPTTTFSVHPNPTNDFIELSTENPTGDYQLLDAQGRIVKTEKIHATNQLIDLTRLQSGIYFVAIDGNVKRFVKE